MNSLYFFILIILVCYSARKSYFTAGSIIINGSAKEGIDVPLHEMESTTNVSQKNGNLQSDILLNNISDATGHVEEIFKRMIRNLILKRNNTRALNSIIVESGNAVDGITKRNTSLKMPNKRSGKQNSVNTKSKLKITVCADGNKDIEEGCKVPVIINEPTKTTEVPLEAVESFDLHNKNLKKNKTKSNQCETTPDACSSPTAACTETTTCAQPTTCKDNIEVTLVECSKPLERVKVSILQYTKPPCTTECTTCKQPTTEVKCTPKTKSTCEVTTACEDTAGYQNTSARLMSVVRYKERKRQKKKKKGS